MCVCAGGVCVCVRVWCVCVYVCVGGVCVLGGGGVRAYNSLYRQDFAFYKYFNYYELGTPGS